MLQALEAALADDHAQTHISSVSPLGLVEMTRKRTRESLEHLLCAPCPTAKGAASSRRPKRSATRSSARSCARRGSSSFSELVVLAHQDVIERLLDEESAVLAELEVAHRQPIRLQTEPLYAATNTTWC